MSQKIFTEPDGIIIESYHTEKETDPTDGQFELRMCAATGRTPIAACTVSISPDGVYIEELSVFEGWRRKGFAKRMMTFIDKQFAEPRSLDQCLLVYASNSEAIALYKQFGFVVTETIPNFSGFRVNMHVMRKVAVKCP